MKDSFNSDVISVVCITELSDSVLLAVLAKDLHRMRETPIIVWLQTEETNTNTFLDAILHLARTNNFLKLMVLHSNSFDIKETQVVYRLQPFPSASLVPITEEIFIKTWNNFMGRTAVILPDLVAPSSLLITDYRTGEQQLFGYADRLIIEFAKKYNITLKFKMPLSEVNALGVNDIYRMTLNGELDLPIRYFAHAPRVRSTQVEYVSIYQLESIFIIVPCGKEMNLKDVYTGLKTYSNIVVLAYFIFAILETLLVAAFYRIIGRRFRFCFGNLFINICAFRGVFGLGIPMNRYGSSFSLKQLVIVMSIFSLIFNCNFNANLSTLLIKQPHYKQIESFEELRNSELVILLDERSYNYIKWVNDEDIYKSLIPNIQIIPTRQREKMLYALNNSYGYQVFTKLWNSLDFYQKHYKVKTMCTSPGLIISDVPVSGILMNNSVFRIALNEYMHQTRSMGFYQHWLKSANQKLIGNFPKTNLINNQESKPLRMDDLKWLWKLMGFCYAVAGLVFAVELLSVYWQKKRARRVIVIRN
ncbi:uncharacterized protein LOC117574397 [Drosophila albomicans]|uniref:Uncharacterized protein LOC117574397 n=1 Tax=Drosophila albomicans TaxID=7291 RepID=A0A6P8ZC13_DROAB|nr:uncharacterized protein LOC117574397 [Drosophila albomicans]